MRRFALLLLVCLLPAAAWAAFASFAVNGPSGACTAYLTGSAAHPIANTPTEPTLGNTYTDPVFNPGACAKVQMRRITNNGVGGSSNNYASNFLTLNSDGTYALVNGGGAGILVINAVTGATIRSTVPFGSQTFNMEWSPTDPDKYYYFSGSSLMRYSVSGNSSATIHTFAASLSSLGGSLNYIDKTGNYFVVNFSGNTTIYDLAANAVYSGGSSISISTGWASITPDAAYMVVVDDSGPPGGATFWAYPIDTVGHAVNTGHIFWTLCGDHSDVMSASNGHEYLIGFDCYSGGGSGAGVWRIDMSLTQSSGNVSQQKSQNTQLLPLTYSPSTNSGHYTCVDTGAQQDWCFIAIEDETSGDYPGTGIPYYNEIIGFNMTTLEVRRYIHHLSNNMNSGGGYYNTPRPSISKDGSKMAYATNWLSGANNSDMFVMEIQW